MSAPKLSGMAIKVIACALMAIDHVGAVLLSPFKGSPTALGAAYLACRIIGRMAFPLFVAMLVVGFHYTHNKKRHLLLLAAFALVSELPYDLAITGGIPSMWWTSQSVMLTLLIAGLVVCVCDLARGKGVPTWGLVPIWLVGAALSFFVHCDYGPFGITAAFVVYLLKNNLIVADAAACVALALGFGRLELASFGSVAFMAAYDGTRGGRGTKFEKMFFYAFYPVHLLLLWLLSLVI